MVGEVDYCLLVGARYVDDLQQVVVGQRIGHARRQLPGKVLIAVRADIAERCSDAIRYSQRRYRPDLAIERVRAATERIGAVVGDQMVGLTI